MGDVVARSSEPGLGLIKLAWWREQLEALDRAAAPPEPRLAAVADHLLPRQISGADVAGIEAGWATLLDDQIAPELVAARGSALFEIGGRLLGSSDRGLSDAGAFYSLVSVGRRGVPELFKPAEAFLNRIRGHRFERRVRPLTMLACAASRDLGRNEREGGRGRVLAMIAHRWSGHIG